MKLYNASPEHTESIRVKLKQPKHIYIVTIIKDEGERIIFTTFDLKYAKKWCKRANKMIKKWQKYCRKYIDNDTYPYAMSFRFYDWQEVLKAVIVKTELR